MYSTYHSLDGSLHVARHSPTLDGVIVFDSVPTVHIKTKRSLLERLRKAKPQAFPLEGSSRRHGRIFPVPFHFARGYTPKCGTK